MVLGVRTWASKVRQLAALALKRDLRVAVFIPNSRDFDSHPLDKKTLAAGTLAARVSLRRNLATTPFQEGVSHETVN